MFLFPTSDSGWSSLYQTYLKQSFYWYTRTSSTFCFSQSFVSYLLLHLTAERQKQCVKGMVNLKWIIVDIFRTWYLGHLSAICWQSRWPKPTAHTDSSRLMSKFSQDVDLAFFSSVRSFYQYRVPLVKSVQADLCNALTHYVRKTHKFMRIILTYDAPCAQW